MESPTPAAAGRPPTQGTGAPARPDQRLRRGQRLQHSACFKETYDQGHRWNGQYMILWRRTAGDAALRLGVVASRRVGGAVQRARAKRRLREVYRRHRYRMQGRFDVILIARNAILRAAWPDVVRDFLALAARARLLAPEARP